VNPICQLEFADAKAVAASMGSDVKAADETINCAGGKNDDRAPEVQFTNSCVAPEAKKRRLIEPYREKL